MTNQEGAISGRIADRPVADLFQWLHETRATGQARFRTALGTATVWLRDGELVDAEMGRFHADAAVLRLIRIQDGEYEVEHKPTSQRRTVKASTAQLLAEGRQRAPRPGPSPAPAARASSVPAPRAGRAVSAGTGAVKAGSGEYSLIREDSGPRPPAGAPSLERTSERARKVDTGAHTLLNAKPVPRPPAKPRAPVTDAQTVVARSPVPTTEPAAPAEPAGSARGPAARRRGMGWSPTAGGKPEAARVEPVEAARVEPARPVPLPHPPPQPAPAAEGGSTRTGRTQFMFGVSGPGSQLEDAEADTSDPATAFAPRQVTPPRATPVAPRFGAVATPASSVASPALPAGAITHPVPPDDSARTPTDARRGARARSRSATRAQAPFEPERADKTLLRAGPVPPPPGQPVVLPASPSQAISVARREEPAPVVVERPAPEPVAAPVMIADEEYSHPISVPTAPSNLGPGGTWALTTASRDKPLPDDPNAEITLSMRAPDVVQARAPSLSSHVKAGGTAHVGRYEVLLRLARGGMGTVYLCRVTGEGGFRRLFALKVIRDHLNTNQSYVRMLLEEARIASRLSHPNIVSIIDIDTFAGQHYLVMDYVEGCTLSELLKAHPKARPPELVVPIVLDALTGLHAAHNMRGDDGSPQPVVHCDFSPQNMLVGVNGTCRLTDFGVSKAADALHEGPPRGKPAYLSPEQVRGLPLDPRSDVFSAGVVLWNALTGEQLFEGDDPQQVLAQVVSRKIPRPSTVGLRPPACFDRICMKALEREPGQRYQTAEQMLTDLRKVAIAEDLLAPSSEVGRWVQETFGAQIELRRQAAGLAPNLAVASLALRDLASAGPTGHSEGLAHEGSVTGNDPNASMTMMLRAGEVREPTADDREGLGPRTRMVVIVAALAFMAAAIVTLFVRPDLLQGGILDENGRYLDLSEIPDPEHPFVGTSNGPTVVGDDSTGATPVVEGATESDTEGDTDTDADTDTEGEPADTEPAAPSESTKGEGKPPRKGKPDENGDDTKADPTAVPKGDDGEPHKGKGKGKGDGGASAPPPDLDELFRPPGG